MTVMLISLITSFIYLTATGLLLRSIYKKIPLNHQGLQACSLSALFLHAYLLYLSIDTAQGQNLSIINMLSFFAWFVLLFVKLSAFVMRKQDSLLVFVMPLTGVLVLAAAFWPGYSLFQTRLYPQTLLHIFISILAFGLLAVASLQAAALAWQNQRLRHKKLTAFNLPLPPLQSLQLLLSRLLAYGFALLTVSLLSGFLFMPNYFKIHPGKTGLSCLAWLIFALILAKQRLAGWQAATLARWTLFGMTLLASGYFGSKLFI